MTNATQTTADQMSLGFFNRFETKVEPYAVGDVLVDHKYERWVVSALTDAYAEPALVCVSQVDGRQAIKFAREIAYRSR